MLGSTTRPGGRPAAACLCCGGQSVLRANNKVPLAAAISLALSAPPPGGAFCGAFFCPRLAPPACPVTANQGCDVDETPSPIRISRTHPHKTGQRVTFCFCCEAPTWPLNPACILWDSQSGPAPPAQLIMLILGPGPPNVPGSLLHPALGSATHADGRPDLLLLSLSRVLARLRLLFGHSNGLPARGVACSLSLSTIPSLSGISSLFSGRVARQPLYRPRAGPVRATVPFLDDSTPRPSCTV